MVKEIKLIKKQLKYALILPVIIHLFNHTGKQLLVNLPHYLLI
jgi:hypothetical protein